MAEKGNKSKDDEPLLLALASGLSIKAAAKKAGFGERTVHKRLDDPVFCARLSAIKSQVFSQAVAKLISAGVQAAETLTDLLGAESESTRLGAARSILELGPKLRESAELEQRIATLESHAAGHTSEEDDDV